MICSTLISSRLGKENPCYTQIRLQKIQILVIRELHNEWLQCVLKLYGTNMEDNLRLKSKSKQAKYRYLCSHYVLSLIHI